MHCFKALYQLRLRFLTETNFPLLLLFFQIAVASVAFSHFDLEDLSQEYILETQKIEIPGHPHAFNPSIIRWGDGILMSFREVLEENPSQTPMIYSSGNSIIGLTWLSEEFDPIGEPYILDLVQDGEVLIPYSRAEDARLITIGDKLYLIYSDNRDPIVTEGGFRMYIGELQYSDEKFIVANIEKLSDFEGESPERREKNWVPFEYDNQLLMAYSLYPHRILRPVLGTGTCDSYAKTLGNLYWYCGELRGGTPAHKIDDDHYLAFFHSSIKIPTKHSVGEEILHYFMGAYLFKSSPPFAITHLSDDPIIGKQFYHGKNYEPYWGPVRVVFPCGYLFDQTFIWLAYGRQDHEIWICKLDKEGLFRSLRPV